MRPANSPVPPGRKVHTVAWECGVPLGSEWHEHGVGPKAAIVVRFVDEDMTFNACVEGTVVYADGDSVKEVVADCVAQLDALHSPAWTEWLWVRFTPEDGYMADHGVRCSRVRVAETPKGKVWQLLIERMPRNSTQPIRGWSPIRPGEPSTGDTRLGDVEMVAFLCEPSVGVENVVLAVREAVVEVKKRLAARVKAVVFAGEDGLKSVLGKPVEWWVEPAVAPHQIAPATPKNTKTKKA